MKEIPIVYGYPSKEALEQAKKRGEIILGGCFYNNSLPKTGYICPICKRTFYRH